MFSDLEVVHELFEMRNNILTENALKKKQCDSKSSKVEGI